MKNINTKLLAIQSTLKAPKGQYNSFGKYKYRSAEDILEAVKPLCAEQGCALTVSDEVMVVGDRFYIKATATLSDCESDEVISISAFAREEDAKKGMDASQVTGACSSYARKYALNGLFCIDDTKDADTDSYTATTRGETVPEPDPNALTNREKVMLKGEEMGLSASVLAKRFNLNRNTTEARFAEVLAELEGR